LSSPDRRFPPPWSIDEADPELDRRCFIVRDANGQALAYVILRGWEPPLIMAKLDSSRPARMALALFGLVVAGVLGVILGVVREAGWLSLIFALAFALALLLEIAGGWQETTRRSQRRLLQAFSFVVGVIILAVVVYREGWEAVLFLLIFLAIWQLATIKTAGDF